MPYSVNQGIRDDTKEPCTVFKVVSPHFKVFNDNVSFSVTLRLQRMLFISVFCQSCCGFLMLVVPNCFIFLCVVLHFENTHKWTIAALLAVSAHSLVDSVIMFISIKPYRNYIWKQIQACLRLRLFFKKASKESTVSVVTRRS